MPDETPPYSDEPYLAGNAYETLVNKEIDANIDLLKTEVTPLVAQYGSFATVLSGMSPSGLDNAYYINPYSFKNDPRYKYVLQNNRSIAIPWNTGSDLQTLNDTRPNDRWKFYLSLQLPGEQGKAKGLAFFEDLLMLATKNQISLMTKTEDHNYDSCDIFTWDPKEMQKVLQELYLTHPDIWQSVPHFFQGQVPGIDPNHIGFVQEPIGGKNGNIRTVN